MIGHGYEHAFSVRAALLAACAALLLLAAGCGGDEATSPSSGPAALAPGNGTVLYAEVEIDPGEERSKEIRETLKKVAKRDLLQLLVDEINESAAEDGTNITYEKDIKPVLGKRAGLFLLSFQNEFDGAVILETKDVEGAREALAKSSKGDKKAEYNGVSYYKDDEGEASGIVAGRIVGGSEAGFKAAVDTLKGPKLAENAQYTKALGKLSEQRLGHVYLDTKALLFALKEQFGPEAEAVFDQAEEQLGAAGGGVAVGVDLTRSGLVVEAAVNAPQVKGSGDASDLIEDFPADAWAAFAAKDVVSSLEEGFMEGFREGFEEESGGLTVQDFKKQFEQLTGVKLDRRLFESIEEIGVYAGGTSLLTIKAGIVARSSDAGRLLSDLKKIAKGLGDTFGAAVSDLPGGGFLVKIPDFPVQIAAGRKDDRVALSLGEPGLEQALEPSQRLGDADAYKAVREQLGDDFKPLLFVLEEPLLTLLESFGQSLGDDFDEVKAYAKALRHIAIGTTGSGDDYRFKIGVGLDE